MITAFLNLSNGNLVLDATGHALKPGLSTNEFLSWRIPFEIMIGHPECPECDIELDEVCEIGDESFYVHLIFSDYCLVRIAIRNASIEYKHGLFFSWNVEKECRKAHEKWLARYAADKKEWTWGSINSSYDEICWGASILICYRDKSGDGV
jgi:hypothetical protein